jgi:hypothetical protein
MVEAIFCGAYNPAMPPYAFSTYIGALCVTRDTDKGGTVPPLSHITNL